MAEIIKETKQLDALKEITHALDVIEKINIALQSDAAFSVVVSDPSRRGAIKIPIDKKEDGKVASLLTAQRNRMAKKVSVAADRYRIALNDADNDVLAGGVRSGSRSVSVK